MSSRQSIADIDLVAYESAVCPLNSSSGPKRIDHAHEVGLILARYSNAEVKIARHRSGAHDSGNPCHHSLKFLRARLRL